MVSDKIKLTNQQVADWTNLIVALKFFIFFSFFFLFISYTYF